MLLPTNLRSTGHSKADSHCLTSHQSLHSEYCSHFHILSTFFLLLSFLFRKHMTFFSSSRACEVSLELFFIFSIGTSPRDELRNVTFIELVRHPADGTSLFNLDSSLNGTRVFTVSRCSNHLTFNSKKKFSSNYFFHTEYASTC